MDQGAFESNINITYCMALPREILNTVELQSITTARASEDYRFSVDNWRIGLTSYLISSLGLVPFKDTFWSNKTNANHPNYYDCIIVKDQASGNTQKYTGSVSVTSKSLLYKL